MKTKRHLEIVTYTNHLCFRYRSKTGLVTSCIDKCSNRKLWCLSIQSALDFQIGYLNELIKEQEKHEKELDKIYYK